MFNPDPHFQLLLKYIVLPLYSLEFLIEIFCRNSFYFSKTEYLPSGLLSVTAQLICPSQNSSFLIHRGLFPHFLQTFGNIATLKKVQYYKLL